MYSMWADDTKRKKWHPYDSEQEDHYNNLDDAEWTSIRGWITKLWKQETTLGFFGIFLPFIYKAHFSRNEVVGPDLEHDCLESVLLICSEKRNTLLHMPLCAPHQVGSRTSQGTWCFSCKRKLTVLTFLEVWYLFYNPITNLICGLLKDWDDKRADSYWTNERHHNRERVLFFFKWTHLN